MGREPWGGGFSMFGGTIRPESRSTIKLILIETEFQQAMFLEIPDSDGFIAMKIAKNQNRSPCGIL
jgi:hypothetical protein